MAPFLQVPSPKPELCAFISPRACHISRPSHPPSDYEQHKPRSCSSCNFLHPPGTSCHIRQNTMYLLQRRTKSHTHTKQKTKSQFCISQSLCLIHETRIPNILYRLVALPNGSVLRSITCTLKGLSNHLVGTNHMFLCRI
jgi:hypothetical protein